MNDVADDLTITADAEKTRKEGKNGQSQGSGRTRKDKEQPTATGGAVVTAEDESRSKNSTRTNHKRSPGGKKGGDEFHLTSPIHPSHPSSAHSSSLAGGEDTSKGRRKRDWKDGQGPLPNGTSHPSHAKNNTHGPQYGLRNSNPTLGAANHHGVVHGKNPVHGSNASRQVHGKPVPSSLPVGAAVPAVTPVRQQQGQGQPHGHNNAHTLSSNYTDAGDRELPPLFGVSAGTTDGGDVGTGNLNGGALLSMLKANAPKIMRYTKEELMSIGQLPASRAKPVDLCSLIDKTNMQSPLLVRSRPDKGPRGSDGEPLKTPTKDRDDESRSFDHRRASDQHYDEKKLSELTLTTGAPFTSQTLTANSTIDFAVAQQQRGPRAESQKFDLWDTPNFVSSREDADLSSITMGDIREVEQQMAESGLSLPEFKAQLEFRRKYSSDGYPGERGELDFQEFRPQDPSLTSIKQPHMLTEQDILAKGGDIQGFCDSNDVAKSHRMDKKWFDNYQGGCEGEPYRQDENPYATRGEEEQGTKVDVNDLFNSASGYKNLPTLPSAGDVPFPFMLMSRGKDASGIPSGHAKGFPGKGEPLSVEEMEMMRYAHKSGKGKAHNSYLHAKSGVNYPPQYSAASAVASAAAKGGYRSQQPHEKGYAGGKYSMQHPGIPVVPHPGAMPGLSMAPPMNSYGKPDYYGMQGGYLVKGGSPQPSQHFMGKGYGKENAQWMDPGLDYYQHYKGAAFAPQLAAPQYPQFPPDCMGGYSGFPPVEAKEEESSCTQS